MNELNFTKISTRRELLKRAGQGAGLLALASLMHEEGLLSPADAIAGTPIDPLAPRPAHFPAKAKSVIWLFMNGGQSHVDTWDYKPELARRDGKPLPNFDKKTGFFPGSVGPLMKSPFKFSQHGQSGKWVSEIFPNIARHVDRMAFVHSGYTDSNNHSPALFMMNTGVPRMGFPCVGSWVTYGLGSVSRNLPSFIVMSDPLGRGLPKGHAANWGAGVFVLARFLDHFDGELARLTGQSSRLGYYLDYVSGGLSYCALFAGMGIGLPGGDLGGCV